MAIRLGRAILLAGIGLAAAPALADDLREALITAYNTNPTLQAARAQQRAVDEGVPIAKAPSLPSLTGTANYVEFVKQSQSSFTAPERALQTQANLGMPVYSGARSRIRSRPPRPGSKPASRICAQPKAGSSARSCPLTWT